MTNILEAIINIVENPIISIRNHYSGRNRMNNVGEALENPNFKITNVQVKNPNNPANLIDAKLIVFKLKK